MVQRNCNNCGAPLEHSYNHKCQYCGTLYDFNEPVNKTIKVKPEDLMHIKLRRTEIIPETRNLLLVFDGYKCEMPKIYEYNSKDNLYISNIQNYINPEKCGFCIELPINEIEKYGINCIKERMYEIGIRLNEIDNITVQILDEMKKYYFIR